MKTPVFVYANSWEVTDGELNERARLTFSPILLKPNRYAVLVGEGTVTYSINDKINFVAQQVAAIEAEREEKKKEYFEIMAKLDEEKSKLLSLEFNGSIR